jgi:hypothetical protein
MLSNLAKIARKRPAGIWMIVFSGIVYDGNLSTVNARKDVSLGVKGNPILPLLVLAALPR